jgi:hypothetical protein
LKKYLSENLGMLRRKLIKWVLGATALLALLAFMLVGPIDRTPLQEQSFYSSMMARLDSLQLIQAEPGKIKSAWSKLNITPSHSTPMAGYKIRNHFDSVHDSLYARLIMIQTGKQAVALINIDLLLFPPALKRRLDEKLSESAQSIFLLVSATHTHNGIGGWDDSLVGKLALGDYNENWIETTAENILQQLLSLKPIPSSIKYWESDASDLVVNRIAFNNGQKDGKLRGLIIQRQDSSRACLFTFSAHPTAISKYNYSLSADYPGSVIQKLEKQFNFGMYMAGMVGSHNFITIPERNYELVEKESDLINEKMKVRNEFESMDSVSISLARVPIEFSPSQLRISKNWKARNWVLTSLFGDLKGELTYFRMGNLIMIGTPCDFSGEISVNQEFETLAANQGKHLIITSFNGNYVGYITDDGHYDTIDNAEVRTMNWVGPYYGEYFSSMIKKLLNKP